MPRGRKPYKNIEQKEKVEFTGNVPASYIEPKCITNVPVKENIITDLQAWAIMHQVPAGWFRELKAIIEKNMP